MLPYLADPDLLLYTCCGLGRRMNGKDVRLNIEKRGAMTACTQTFVGRELLRVRTSLSNSSCWRIRSLYLLIRNSALFVGSYRPC